MDAILLFCSHLIVHYIFFVICGSSPPPKNLHSMISFYSHEEQGLVGFVFKIAMLIDSNLGSGLKIGLKN